MAVAAQGDTRVGPAAANVPNQAAQMRPYLNAARHLAGPQDHGDRPAALGVVHMDRQKAVFVIIGVEQRQLLTAMHHVDRVIDVQRDRARRTLVTAHPKIDKRIAQSDHLAQIGGILQAGEGRLRTQIPIRVRQPAAGKLERRIPAQMIEIIAVLIAARDGEDAGADQVAQSVRDACRIAPLGKHTGQLLGHPDPPIRQGKKHDASIRRQPAAIEGGRDLLASNGWK
jgi:hypothetical protein